MRNTYYLLLLMLALFSACSNNQIISPILKKTSEDINKQCPAKIDIATILVNTEALPNRILKYNYKLNLKDNDLDTVLAKDAIKHRILYTMFNNPEVKSLLSQNFTFLHNYCDLNGKYLFQFTVTPDEYSAKANRKKETIAEVIPSIIWTNRMMFPIQLDEITKIVDTQYAEPDTMVTIYELEDDNFHPDEMGFQLLKESLIKSTKENQATNELKDLSCIFKHVYYSASGNNDMVFIITPEDYK